MNYIITISFLHFVVIRVKVFVPSKSQEKIFVLIYFYKKTFHHIKFHKFTFYENS